MDLDLSEEQQLISETARKFADEYVIPRLRENDREQRFDLEQARKLGEMGYLGAPIAEEYGGRGLDHVTYALIVEQIGRADSAARTVVSVQTSLVCGSIERWGTEEQKRRWLPGPLQRRGVRLLRPDRARVRLRRGLDAHPRRSGSTAAGGSTARRCGSRSATSPTSRSSSPRPIRRRPTAASPASSSRPTRPGSPRRRSTASSACAPPTPPRSPSTISRSATTPSSARSGRASRSR